MSSRIRAHRYWGTCSHSTPGQQDGRRTLAVDDLASIVPRSVDTGSSQEVEPVPHIGLYGSLEGDPGQSEILPGQADRRIHGDLRF